MRLVFLIKRRNFHLYVGDERNRSAHCINLLWSCAPRLLAQSMSENHRIGYLQPERTQAFSNHRDDTPSWPAVTWMFLEVKVSNAISDRFKNAIEPHFSLFYCGFLCTLELFIRTRYIARWIDLAARRITPCISSFVTVWIHLPGRRTSFVGRKIFLIDLHNKPAD